MAMDGPLACMNLSSMNSVPFSLPEVTSSQAFPSATSTSEMNAPTEAPSSTRPEALPVRGSWSEAADDLQQHATDRAADEAAQHALPDLALAEDAFCQADQHPEDAPSPAPGQR